MAKKTQLTVNEARRWYWSCIEEYEATRRDDLSTYWQLRDAAARVSQAREEWFRAAARQMGTRTPFAARLAAAKVNVCKETGELAEAFNNDRKGR